jgi:hypothetical protein
VISRVRGQGKAGQRSRTTHACGRSVLTGAARRRIIVLGPGARRTRDLCATAVPGPSAVNDHDGAGSRTALSAPAPGSRTSLVAPRTAGARGSGPSAGRGAACERSARRALPAAARSRRCRLGVASFREDLGAMFCQPRALEEVPLVDGLAWAGLRRQCTEARHGPHAIPGAPVRGVVDAAPNRETATPGSAKHGCPCADLLLALDEAQEVHTGRKRQTLGQVQHVGAATQRSNLPPGQQAP